MADASDKLKALEKSLGGPNGAALLIACDEPPKDISDAFECLEPDTEYRICVREFQGCDTYIITARTPSSSELEELERLLDETSPEGEGGEGEGDEDEDPEEEDPED